MISIATLIFIASIVYASIFEWILHKYWMHKPIGIFGMKIRYPFEKHALTHHKIFKADHSYHLQKDEDKWTIPMAWWNGPILILVASLPWIGFDYLFSFLFPYFFSFRFMAIIPTLTISAYYGTYEYLHWCMHLPKKRRLEKSWLFWFLNGHHILHHRYMDMNYNVVLPIADILFQTMLIRSRIRFSQPEGENMPNVQPL